MTVQF